MSSDALKIMWSDEEQKPLSALEEREIRYVEVADLRTLVDCAAQMLRQRGDSWGTRLEYMAPQPFSSLPVQPLDTLRPTYVARVRLEEAQDAEHRYYAQLQLLPPTGKAPRTTPVLPALVRAFAALPRGQEARREAPPRWRVRPVEIVQWYYDDLAARCRMTLRGRLQQFLRDFVTRLAILRELQDGKPDVQPTWADVQFSDKILDEQARFRKTRKTEEESEQPDQTPSLWRRALVEVCHGLGMLAWPPSWKRAEAPRVFEIPDPSVLLAKLFGLKTAIAGLDDLTGGGLILGARTGRLDDQIDDIPSLAPGGKQRLVPPDACQGVLGVIRGRFGTAKSTLAAQLAFEMARKGGVGVLMVLEQSPHEVISMAYHHGWLPQDGTFDLIHDGRLYKRDQTPPPPRGTNSDPLPAEMYFAYRLEQRQDARLRTRQHPDPSTGDSPPSPAKMAAAARGLLYIRASSDAT